MLFDAHCHLDWTDAPAAVAADAAAAGLSLTCCTVTPDGYLTAAQELGSCPNVLVGAGLHPWWLANGTCGAADVDALCELSGQVPLIGEVGLDFSPRRSDAASNELQVNAFRRICAAAAGASGEKYVPTMLSIHAVGATGATLDVLEATGVAASCACVLHWFSGTSDELARARRLGSWFSVGERMLATRRGREYARQMPEGRLLLETDLPDACNTGLGTRDLLASLERAADAMAQVRGTEPARMREVLAANAALAAPAVCGRAV